MNDIIRDFESSSLLLKFLMKIRARGQALNQKTVSDKI